MAANRNQDIRKNYNRKAYQEDSDSDSEDRSKEDRLLKDYEISSNLHKYVKNHENYLCLNKL